MTRAARISLIWLAWMGCAGVAFADPAATSGRLVVRSVPEGATVSVDGTAVGVTLLEYGVSPGTHSVVVERAGFARAVRQVAVEPGETQVLEVVLDGAEPTGGGVLRVAKWTSAGAGAACLIAGAWLLAIGDSANIEGGVRQPRANDDAAVGGVLVGVGAVAAAVSGYLFWRDGRRSEVVAVGGAIWGRSGSVAVQVRF
jgi:hypothetical protein